MVFDTTRLKFNIHSKKKQPLPSLQVDSASFMLVWMDLKGFYSLSRTMSFNDALIVVQHPLVACCRWCIRFSKRFKDRPEVTFGEVWDFPVNFYILKTPNRSFGIIVTVFSSTRFSNDVTVTCDLNVITL